MQRFVRAGQNEGIGQFSEAAEPVSAAVPVQGGERVSGSEQTGLFRTQ